MAKILVVENDPVSIRLLKSILVKGGHTVFSAESAVQALTMVETDVPDIVISDIMMPAVDGIALLSKLRRMPLIKDTPIIMCSAKGDQESVIKCLKLGASDYIVKPIQPATLLAKLAKFLDSPVNEGEGAPESSA